MQWIGMNYGIWESSLKNSIRLIFHPTFAGAPPVEMITGLIRGTSKVFIVESNEFLISTLRVDSRSAYNSSLTTNSGETKRIKTANCERSVIYINSSRANLNAVLQIIF